MNKYFLFASILYLSLCSDINGHYGKWEDIFKAKLYERKDKVNRISGERLREAETIPGGSLEMIITPCLKIGR